MLVSASVSAGARPLPPPAHNVYFVSPSGDDSGPGTRTRPLATIQAGVNRLGPGDVLNVMPGEYHESVRVPHSGTEAAPITIQAYAGACPALIGAQPVAGPWMVHSGSIYKAAWPSQPQQVFVDGQLLNEARWPNSPLESLAEETYARADSGGPAFITQANLPAVDLTGAWVQIAAGQSWVGYSRQISAHDQQAGRLSWTKPINQLPELIPRRNNKFFVFGKLELLDSPGEWYWDPAQRQLYVWTPNGGAPDGRVEAGAATAVLDLSGQSNVIVRGLSARGGWFNLHDSVNCSILGCHLRAPTWMRTYDGYAIWPEPSYLGGIDVSGSGNLVQGGSVRLSGRGGVHLMGSNNTVRQIAVEDSGLNWTNDAPIDVVESQHSLVEQCTVRRVAAAGIVIGPLARILSNLVEEVGLIHEDLGNVNAWSVDGQGTEIAYNDLTGNDVRWGAAVYLDAGSHDFYVHDNLIHGILWNGMNITGATRVENNTILDIQHAGINYVPGAGVTSLAGGNTAHNRIEEHFPLDVAFIQPVSLIPDYGAYEAYTTLDGTPKRVEIDWSQLAQPGWSQMQVPLNFSRVDAVNFSLQSPAVAFHFAIANLRLLPAGAAGDEGAVPLTGSTWTATGASGSTCSLAENGPTAWGASGVSDPKGSNVLSARTPARLLDFTAYRGLAFDLTATAARDYNYFGVLAVDNGPEALPGRGATLPFPAGADPAGAEPPCRAHSLPRAPRMPAEFRDRQTSASAGLSSAR